MEKAIHHLTDQLRTIRTGRASPALVDTIKADYYGTPTPLNQLAHISVPEPRQLVVKPFDQNALKEIEKAILTSDLGLTPSSDGKLLRLVLPPLSEEQRRKISGKVKEITEASRVVLRNARRDANKASDAAKKAGSLSEDLNASKRWRRYSRTRPPRSWRTEGGSHGRALRRGDSAAPGLAAAGANLLTPLPFTGGRSSVGRASAF
ncbi:MAG: ribosome recycling factor [Planctomycetota bacterium]